MAGRASSTESKEGATFHRLAKEQRELGELYERATHGRALYGEASLDAGYG